MKNRFEFFKKKARTLPDCNDVDVKQFVPGTLNDPMISIPLRRYDELLKAEGALELLLSREKERSK